MLAPYSDIQPPHSSIWDDFMATIFIFMLVYQKPFQNGCASLLRWQKHNKMQITAIKFTGLVGRGGGFLFGGDAVGFDKR